eukprot:Plantae.Rhodophyta-Rhodochaete_pulchella.ctg18052.p1 GENE.Plantae.Rhodophyta-Rhodochaete_pulchella.ctg18052~~Plantae.Rhodophyta-Rhodochaete_pulchella.ctg18052.p1  ORF type:complete len:378 (-),score=23.72 Plantae.Rhodophyta-Rhodochaete_pulchella.ctg18052:485-1618(-)
MVTRKRQRRDQSERTSEDDDEDADNAGVLSLAALARARADPDPRALQTYLAQLVDSLKPTGQKEVFPADTVTSGTIVSLAKELTHTRLLRHRMKEIRLPVACCLVEMFRVLAPDAPLTGKAVRDVFSLFIASLAHLADVDSPFFIDRVFLLLRAAASNSRFRADCRSPRPNRRHLYNASRCSSRSSLTPLSHQGRRITDSSRSRLRSRCNAFHAGHHACPTCSRTSRQRASDVAKRVIVQAQTYLQIPVGALLAPRADPELATDNDSPLLEHSEQLLLELNHLDASLLTHVVPRFAKAFVSEDLSTRRKATDVGRLFADPTFTYIETYSALWTQYLRRCGDSEPSICVQVANALGDILSNHSTTVNDVVRRLSAMFI